MASRLRRRDYRIKVNISNGLFRAFINQRHLLFKEKGRFRVSSIRGKAMVFHVTLFRYLVIVKGNFFRGTNYFNQEVSAVPTQAFIRAVRAYYRARCRVSFIHIMCVSANINGLAFPIFERSQFRLNFRGRAFPTSLITMGRPFIRLTFTIHVMRFEIFMLITPLFSLLRYAPFRVTKDLSIRSRAIIDPFLRNYQVE